MNTAPFLSSGSPGRFHWRSRIARRLNVAQSLFLAFLTALTLSAASPPSTADLRPEEFKEAIRAQDYKLWKESGELLLKALKKQEEDGSHALLYGGWHTEYLPHYYLGIALYQQKDYAGAMKE